MEIVYLHNNVLTDDYVIIKNNEYELHYFVYATSHTDKENIIKFQTFKDFEKFYNKLNRGNVYEYF